MADRKDKARTPRVFFYVQHLLGIGHLARASRVAAALQNGGFDVTLVTGGVPVKGFPGDAIKQFALPPVIASSGFAGLSRPDGTPVDESFISGRRNLLLNAYADLQPDIVIIEAFPFGRRQMRFELQPLLEAISASDHKPLLVTSVRDILQERVKPGRNEESVEQIKNFFDVVMIHGDPTLCRLEESFPLAASIADKVRYTGLVAGPAAPPSAEKFDILVSAGGGAAGKALVQSAVEAARLAGNRRKWGLITGPNLPEADFRKAEDEAPAHMAIFRFREDFPNLLAAAELSVSQAGYNTACDLLRAGCRILFVPFAADGETEQTSRARKLEAKGLARVIREDELTPQSLLAAIEEALSKPKPPTSSLDFDGARNSAELLHRLLAARHS